MTSPVAKAVDPDPKGVPEPGLPIAEVAQRTGLSKDTLRYYETVSYTHLTLPTNREV